MAFFNASHTPAGWWVPITLHGIQIKVLIEGGHKTIRQVHAEFYDEILPTLGINVEEEDIHRTFYESFYV